MSAVLPLTQPSVFRCGPVAMELDAPSAWIDRLSSELRMFDVPFDGPECRVHFAVTTDMEPSPAVRGGYLQCHRFQVDRNGQHFLLSSPSGAWCRFDAASRSARAFAPDAGPDAVEDVEQFLIFTLTWGWRALGWTPLHVATIERDGRCALVCAESCGGKSTFTAACVRHGFGTLGDDKVLVRPSAPVTAYALSSSMNLDPSVARWFPEAAGISTLAPYSRWSPKRKVRMESLWPGAPRRHAVPTVLLKLTRSAQGDPISLQPLLPQAILNALARQIVIPNDRQAAAVVLPAIMHLSTQLRGWTLNVTPDAYLDPNHLRVIEDLFP